MLHGQSKVHGQFQSHWDKGLCKRMNTETWFIGDHFWKEGPSIKDRKDFFKTKQNKPHKLLRLPFLSNGHHLIQIFICLRPLQVLPGTALILLPPCHHQHTQDLFKSPPQRPPGSGMSTRWSMTLRPCWIQAAYSAFLCLLDLNLQSHSAPSPSPGLYPAS